MAREACFQKFITNVNSNPKVSHCNTLNNAQQLEVILSTDIETHHNYAEVMASVIVRFI